MLHHDVIEELAKARLKLQPLFHFYVFQQVCRGWGWWGGGAQIATAGVYMILVAMGSDGRMTGRYHGGGWRGDEGEMAGGWWGMVGDGGCYAMHV